MNSAQERSVWDADDFVLSQALDVFENSSLSQTLEVYDFDSDDVLDDVDFGNFDTKNLEVILPCDSDETDVKSHAADNAGRFGPVCEEVELADIKKNTESRNTRKNTNWSTTTFNEWRRFRQSVSDVNIPDVVQMTENDVNKWLSRFVMEARRKDGGDYPPRTIYQLCVGLMRYMQENGNHINFLDEKNPKFYEFRKVLSARMSQLTAKGVGVVKKQADPLTKENERVMWEKGIFGNSSAKSLLNTVFFYNCKLFGLRGVDEHKSLCVEQFTLHDGNAVDMPYLTFSGRTSKTYKGGLNQRHMSAKSIKHVFNDDLLYNVYTEYIDLIKKDMPDQNNEQPLYMRPLNDKKQFSKQCIGINKLSGLMKSMCAEAGLEGNFTNHSGKRTCATSLYQAGIEEQEIMARTGHRSINSVRQYKRPSEQMLRDISNVLEPCVNSTGVKRVKNESEPCQPDTQFASAEKTVYSNCVFNFQLNVRTFLFSAKIWFFLIKS